MAVPPPPPSSSLPYRPRCRPLRPGTWYLELWDLHAGSQPLAACAQVDPSVSASVYYAASLYHRDQKEFAKYYKAALMYLAFESLDKLDDKTKLVGSLCLSFLSAGVVPPWDTHLQAAALAGALGAGMGERMA